MQRHLYSTPESRSCRPSRWCEVCQRFFSLLVYSISSRAFEQAGLDALSSRISLSKSGDEGYDTRTRVQEPGGRELRPMASGKIEVAETGSVANSLCTSSTTAVDVDDSSPIVKERLMGNVGGENGRRLNVDNLASFSLPFPPSETSERERTVQKYCSGVKDCSRSWTRQ